MGRTRATLDEVRGLFSPNGMANNPDTAKTLNDRERAVIEALRAMLNANWWHTFARR